MIKRIFISAISLVVCYISWAQIDSPYLDDSLYGATITLKAKSYIYAPNQEQAGKIASASRWKSYFSFFVNPEFFKPKKISKQTDLLVTGFIKTAKEFYYDLYMVVYNDKLYFVYPSDVIDNALIDNKNRQMDEYYSQLIDDLASKQKTYDILIRKKETEIEAALQDIQRKKDNQDALVDSLYEDMLAKKLNPMKEAYAKWYGDLSVSAKKAANIIAITESKLDTPNSAGGCDYSFVFTNNSKKTIKYLHWYGNVYNAVGDKVECDIQDTYSFSGKDTGPYLPGKIGGGVWECIIYNWSAKEMRLNSISINYTDGSSVSIPAKDIAEITGAPQSSMYDFEYSLLRSDAKRNFDRSIGNDNFIWSKRKEYLSFLDQVAIAPNEVKTYFEEVTVLKKEIADLKETVRKFEEINFIVK